MSKSLNTSVDTAIVFIRNHDGKPVNVDLASYTPELLGNLLVAGAKTILTNVWNGGGKEATDAERFAKLQGKLDAWAKGDFNVTERGAAQSTLMWECYITEMQAKSPEATEKAIKDQAAKLVKACFGDKEKATFDNLLNALATQLSKAGRGEVADIKAKLVTKYEAAAAELDASRAAAGKVEVDLTAIDF